MRVQNMFSVAGPQAERIAELWWITFAICLVVFAAVLVATGLALWKGRKGTGSGHGAHLAVASAVGVSTVLLLFLIVASVATDRALAQIDASDALKIEVVGNRWWWDIRYQDPDPSRRFTTANEIAIPVGRAVELTLRANDVIHSFWVPALHGKKDLIPGRTATLTLRADKPGTYRGQCAEFCGVQHAKMALFVYALPAQEYEAWAEQQRRPAPPPADGPQQLGHDLFVKGTCAMCHAIQGTPANGRRAPDLTHFASRKTIGAGTVPNDPQQLAVWISDPHAVKPGVNMPAHAFLKREELAALVAYLGSLK
ncbi:MAG TPA: cytochrome c oxidase subunit II [Burkholderiales bacterium]|nr:cytochrome c oxidase subunit II [Burkholderiales bacterium]